MSYLVFTYSAYYPYGGAHDLQGRFKTFKEALVFLYSLGPRIDDYAHILNSETGHMNCWQLENGAWEHHSRKESDHVITKLSADHLLKVSPDYLALVDDETKEK